MGKSPRNSQGRSIARRMESSGGRRKEKGTGLVPGTKKHGGLFSDDAIASFDELLNSDDNTFRTAPGPPVSRAPPPEPNPNAVSSGMSSWIPSALRTASSGRWLSWINVVMLVVLLCGAGVAYVYVGGSEWTEPMEADMMYADTADMVESAAGDGAVGTPPSPKDIIEEYRRKRLAKEAKEAEERETRLKAARDTPLIEPTPTPLPEPDPMPTPEVMAPPPRRAMKPKPKSTAATSGRKGGGKTSGPVSSGEDPATTTTRPRGETDAERTARYAREDAEREARIKAEDEERAARIEEEETRARARVEELAVPKAQEVVEEAVVEEEEAPVVEEEDEDDEEEEEEMPAPVARKKKREAPAAAGNLGVDYE